MPRAPEARRQAQNSADRFDKEDQGWQGGRDTGLVGHSATQALVDNFGEVAPGAARTIFVSAVHNLQNSRGTAGVVFVAGLAGAIWSASGYIGAFMRASNAIYDIEGGRPLSKTVPVRPG